MTTGTADCWASPWRRPSRRTRGSTSCTPTTHRSVGSAPVWNDGCPTPPGPTTDGCVVSGRLSRLQANGDVMTGTEQVLINDWCQQFPSHSIGTVRFGPDGALYVSAGDGASFNGADYGQYGGSAGSPTPKNPCGDPPAGVGGTESLPSAEGGALRSQDIRTMPARRAATPRPSRPTARALLAAGRGERHQAADQQGTSTGTYSAGVTRGQPGATSDGDAAVDPQRHLGLRDRARRRGPAARRRPVHARGVGQPAHPGRDLTRGDQEQVFDQDDGGYQVNIQNNGHATFDQAGRGRRSPRRLAWAPAGTTWW